MENKIDVLTTVLAGKRAVLLAVLLFAVLAFALSFLIQRSYRAQVVFTVASADDSSALAQVSRQIPIAALAGFLGDPRGSGRQESLAVLRSRELSEKFMEKNGVLQVMFADRWDARRNEWKVEPEDRPTMSDAWRRFDRKVRNISEDRVTGIITVTLEWPNPRQAAQLANGLVAEADLVLRNREIGEAQRSLQYLQQEAARTNLVELQTAIFNLAEEQVKRVMLAKVRDNFAFKIIDPAVAPDQKHYSRPNRLSLTIVGGLFGLIAGVVSLIWLRTRRLGAAR